MKKNNLFFILISCLFFSNILFSTHKKHKKKKSKKISYHILIFEKPNNKYDPKTYVNLYRARKKREEELNNEKMKKLISEIPSLPQLTLKTYLIPSLYSCSDLKKNWFYDQIGEYDPWRVLTAKDNLYLSNIDPCIRKKVLKLMFQTRASRISNMFKGSPEIDEKFQKFIDDQRLINSPDILQGAGLLLLKSACLGITFFMLGIFLTESLQC